MQQPSFNVENRATVHFVEQDLLSELTGVEVNENFPLEELDLDRLLVLLRERQYPLHRGDVIYLAPVGGYRNVGKYFFDGQAIVDYDSELDDDYGSVIPEFLVPLEFPPRYWSEQINDPGNETRVVAHNEDVPYRYTGWSRKPTRDDIYLTLPDIRGNQWLVLPVRVGPEIYYFWSYEEPSETAVNNFLEKITNPEIQYFFWDEDHGDADYPFNGPLELGLDRMIRITFDAAW